MFGIRSLVVLTAVLTAPHARAAAIQLAEGDNALSGTFQMGDTQQPATITVRLDDGRSHGFPVRIEPERFRRKIEEKGATAWEDMTLPDGIVDFRGLVRYYSRPRMQRYTAEQQAGLAAQWSRLPAASKRFITFEARQDARGTAFYLDGRYVGRRDAEGKLAALEFALPASGSVRDLRSFRTYEGPDTFLPLDVKWIANPGVMKDATLSVAAGAQSIGGVPMIIAGGEANVDVGVVKECKGSWALECDEHLARTALDGMPETAHLSVPQAAYVRAWVLCAVDPAPDRDPILTTRLTRFAPSGRGGAIADTTLTLPRSGEPQVPGVKQVGTVRYPKDGQMVEVPLLLAEFPLRAGEILDLLAMEEDPHASMTRQPYLDFEFLGKLDGLSAQWDRRHKPDKKSTSAVHVFGATLERSPVLLRLTSDQPGNIFHNDERPELSAVMTAARPGSIVLNWRVFDADRRTVRQAEQEVEFTAAGEEKKVNISLDPNAVGWFGVELSLRDGGRELFTHTAACAVLGRDTRQAGYDSPYGTWWFAGAHYGASDKEVAGPMLFKAGLRKTTFGWNQYTEADMAPWKITLNQLGWRLAPKDMSDQQKAYDEAEAKIREMREKFPHCRDADIFHESYAHYIPAELLDEKPDEDAASIEAARRRVELAEFAARFYRERFPDIRLLVGNTSSSTSIIASLLRHGFDPKHIDFIGVEAVGQTGTPELLWEGSTQGLWLAREVARKFGHDLPVTGCYEFTARVDRNLGMKRQAEWIVRDMLLCHAYQCKHINPAIIHDAGNAYFNSLWGAGGLCQRNPLLYPKPAYVAVAALTKALDRVQPPKRIDTGSTTVYALEFPRADGKRVHALWTASGTAGLNMTFAEDTEAALIGFFGDTQTLGRRQKAFEVQCGTAPVYVVAPIACQSIDIHTREFAAPPGSFRVVDAMADLARWSNVEGDPRLAQPTSRGLPVRVAGHFTLLQVDDEEKGTCLQLELKRNGRLPDIVGEYTRLKRNEAEPVPGAPTAVGVWVKGDSGWGKIIFEIEDATGAVWMTEGVWHDWPGDLAICHDGWRFMSFPIDGNTDIQNISPGARWTSTSPGRKPTIQFPIKLVGLSVAMNRRALDLNEMKDVPGILRFRDLGVVAETDSRRAD